MTRISGAVKEVDSQIEQVLTAGHAEAELESVLEYKMKIVESLSKIDLKLEEYEMISHTYHRAQDNNATLTDKVLTAQNQAT